MCYNICPGKIKCSKIEFISYFSFLKNFKKIILTNFAPSIFIIRTYIPVNFFFSCFLIFCGGFISTKTGNLSPCKNTPRTRVIRCYLFFHNDGVKTSCKYGILFFENFICLHKLLYDYFLSFSFKRTTSRAIASSSLVGMTKT